MKERMDINLLAFRAYVIRKMHQILPEDGRISASLSRSR